MTTVILTTSDYPAIRATMGITIDDIPDADFDSIGLLDVAEEMVKALVTDYATIISGGGANKVFLQAGTLNLCAALCINKLEMQRSQAFRKGDYSESETKADWEGMRCKYLEASKGFLMRIATHAHTRRTLFSATGSTSSHQAWPSLVQQWFARIEPHVVEWLKTNGHIQFGWESQP